MSSQSAGPTAQRLLRARERAGYGNAHDVADAFGWPDYPLDESGERPLTAVRAKLYAHAFHVDPDWLLSEKEEPAAAPGDTSATISEPPEPTDELAERIRRLSRAQRLALLTFLRTMQEGG